MNEIKISTLIAIHLLSSPITLTAATSGPSQPLSEITSQRASLRKMRDQTAEAPLLKPMGTYVGELQERWQFPSDHLPIAMTYDDLQFVSWNVLDADFMDWVIEKNSQGLSHSMIADEHVYIGDSKLTLRDQHVADKILEMINHPTHPRGILSLQECSDPLAEELRSRLPEHFEVVKSHGEAVIIDLSQFELLETKEIKGLFSNEPYRGLLELNLRRLDNNQEFRLINVHLPGDPTKPARFEFAQYLAKTFDPNKTTIVMGDMNFNELEMADAMRQAFPTNSPFSISSPYCTNISPKTFDSKAIDHFIVYSAEKTPVRLNDPNQIMAGLDQLVSLLEGAPDRRLQKSEG